MTRQQVAVVSSFKTYAARETAKREAGNVCVVADELNVRLLV